MIDPKKMHIIAKKYEDENIAFRAFLKGHADEDELDSQFLQLHNELFAGYDCCKCANCCQAYAATLNESDVDAISEYIGQDKNDFIAKYLKKSEYDTSSYTIKPEPCIFLCDPGNSHYDELSAKIAPGSLPTHDGKCMIYDVRPAECKGFPFTDRPERLWHLLGVISFADVCPVVFEILQRLKKIYKFRYR
ncbi:MAG: YkgJ family cysteine cluster protein [Firmicutes bacterium]|nr:YkgJ family cysteine cluster protein [Bacillota bacterium]